MNEDLIQYENAGDFLRQRAEFRKEALRNLRKREGLPIPTIDENGRAIYLDSEGKPHSWAIGKKQGLSREEASQYWEESAPFEILDVAADGRPIQDEIRDLERDAELNRKTANVDFGVHSAPDLQIGNIYDEEQVDQAIQQYIERHL